MSDNPITPPLDDLEDVMTSYGLIPRWKARALALGELQAVINDAVAQVRADDAKDDRPQLETAPPKHKPPALAADDTTSSKSSIDAEHLAALEAAVDALTARMDRFEAAQTAQRKLEELEDAIAATLPPESSDGVTLN
jgi:hypothetical protein